MYYIMLICAIAESVLFLALIYLFVKYRHQFDGLLEDVDGKIFTLKEMYFIGLGCIEIVEKKRKKKITASDKALKKMNELAEVFGKNNAELYYYISASAKISLILIFAPVGLALVCLLKSVLGIICGALIAYILPYGTQSSINAALQNKKDAIINEFPKMVSKLTLLINAGMLVRRAWDEVANSNFEEALYEEMRITSKDIQEGMSIESAMQSFAARCGIKEIRKFSSLYVQAINKGASETIHSMKAMADDAWIQKKELSKQKGELASQKLMIPNLIMFLGILVVVVAPMIISMFGNF